MPLATALTSADRVSALPEIRRGRSWKMPQAAGRARGAQLGTGHGGRSRRVRAALVNALGVLSSSLTPIVTMVEKPQAKLQQHLAGASRNSSEGPGQAMALSLGAAAAFIPSGDRVHPKSRESDGGGSQPARQSWASPAGRRCPSPSGCAQIVDLLETLVWPAIRGLAEASAPVVRLFKYIPNSIWRAVRATASNSPP